MTGFHVSFRAQHPVRDLSNLLDPLSVVPSHCWQAGDQRRTPKGEPLEGTRAGSYYCSDLPFPDCNDLAEWLEQAVVFLHPVAKQLVSFVDDGGALSFYIGLEKGVFLGAILNPKLLAQLGALRISLDIDRNL